MDRGYYSRYVKEVRPSNTPLSRDLREFDCKFIEEMIDGVEENEMEGR